MPALPIPRAMAGASTIAHVERIGAHVMAGAAILRNGHTITWLGGDDSTHVKGAVQ